MTGKAGYNQLKKKEKLSSSPDCAADEVVVENNYLHVNEKSALEVALRTLRTSKDSEELARAEKEAKELIELDISRDQNVIAACANGNAGSPACANARLDVIAAKHGYENLGNYNSRGSQQYSDAYGQIVSLLNITSVDAQNQQQVKDAMVNYTMAQLGVDKATATAYIETYDGIKIVVASMSAVLGTAVANKLSAMVKEANIYPSGISFKIDQPEHLSQLASYT